MTVKFAILGILADQPRHGYELKQIFEERVGEIWPLNYGQIYSTLERLHKEGLVDLEQIEQSDKPDKKIYAITAAGRAEFEAWRRSPIKLEPRALRDELFLRLVFISPSEVDYILRLIQQQQTVYLSHMMQITNRKVEIEDRLRRQLAQPLDPAERERVEHERLIGTLLADVALFHAEADIRWLRHCEAKLKAVYQR